MSVDELHSYLKSQGLSDSEMEALAKELIAFVEEV